jgi:hypothetical protein
MALIVMALIVMALIVNALMVIAVYCHPEAHAFRAEGPLQLACNRQIASILRRIHRASG